MRSGTTQLMENKHGANTGVCHLYAHFLVPIVGTQRTALFKLKTPAQGSAPSRPRSVAGRAVDSGNDNGNRQQATGNRKWVTSNV